MPERVVTELGHASSSRGNRSTAAATSAGGGASAGAGADTAIPMRRDPDPGPICRTRASPVTVGSKLINVRFTAESKCNGLNAGACAVPVVAVNAVGVTTSCIRPAPWISTMPRQLWNFAVTVGG